MNNSGIYKIISPSGKIYIGQSINIKARKHQYKNFSGNDSSVGPILLNSLLKYGFDAHKFDVIEECSINQLCSLETWYKLCCVIDMGWSNCLFCNLIDGKGGNHSDKTKQKMSETHQMYLVKPEILNKRLINCKKSSTLESKNKRIQNTNWVNRNKKLTQASRKHYKLIEKYDLDNNKIQDYINVNDILNEFNNPRPQNLYSCLKGTYKTWMGYKWKGYLK